MALETAPFINSFVEANPTAADPISQGDDHIRLIKSSVKATFPNLTGAVTATQTELNYTAGVTSAVQAQINTKAPLASPALTGVPTAPTAAAGTNTTQIASTAFVKAAADAVTLASLGVSATAAQLNFSTGVTSNLQTQLNAKQANLGFTPVQQGGGTGQWGNKIYLGWDGSSLRLTVDTTDIGLLVTEGRLPWLIAAQGFGAVGTYVFGWINQGYIYAGNTYAGSSIHPSALWSGAGVITADSAGVSSMNWTRATNSLSGTWKAMGQQGYNNSQTGTLFMRIS